MKIIIATVAVLLTLGGGYFGYTTFMKSDPLLTDEAMNYWVHKCGDNSSCQVGIKKSYSKCVNSVSFERPVKGGSSDSQNYQRDLQEYLNLVKVEIGECLSESAGVELS